MYMIFGFALFSFIALLLGCVIVISPNEKKREDEEQMHWIKDYQEN